MKLKLPPEQEKALQVECDRAGALVGYSGSHVRSLVDDLAARTSSAPPVLNVRTLEEYQRLTGSVGGHDLFKPRPTITIHKGRSVGFTPTPLMHPLFGTNFAGSANWADPQRDVGLQTQLELAERLGSAGPLPPPDLRPHVGLVPTSFVDLFTLHAAVRAAKEPTT